MEKFKIEVALPNSTSTTEKGMLLESLVSEVLECLNYKVERQVSFSGMEIDVLAINNKSGCKIFVECKAHRNSIEGDVITKLAGQVFLKKVKSGWLFYTSELSKGAKGILDDIQASSTDDRDTIQIYSPKELIEILENNRRIVKYCDINKPADNNYSETNYFLITPYGKFWVFPINNSGVETSVITYDASTGELVQDATLLKKISETDTSLNTLDWHPTKISIEKIEKTLENQKDNIVPISVGDEWADYRPSRPQDYVGREVLLGNILKFLDKIRKDETCTRMIGLQAPSGWGKSSTIVKLIDMSKNIRNRKNLFIYGVDTRAAVSDKYVELVLLSCLEKAMAEGFLPKQEKKTKLGSAGSILESESLRNILSYLKQEKKVILIYFDQFEELFLKEELFSLFGKFRQLIDNVCSLQENIVVGFAWKTDTNIPAEHPAYKMWHDYSDRRKDFRLDLFARKEVSTTITKLEKELSQKVDPKLRKNLSDHCQGYPWLLKKLCIYVYSSIKNKCQTDLLVEKLNVKDLFEQDLNNLTEDERQCVKFVAERSPANIIELSERFSSDIINNLVNKRILIKSGLNVSLYWDIFRDYISSGKVPVVPETYICTTHVGSYYKVIKDLIGKKNITIEYISNRFGLKEGSADNIVRDAVMMGNARRKGNVITLIQDNITDLGRTIKQFYQDHIFFNKLKYELQNQTRVTLDDAIDIMKDTYNSQFEDKTWRLYTTRMISWFEVCGLIRTIGNIIELEYNKVNIEDALQNSLNIRRRNNTKTFKGGAPYTKVCELLQKLYNNEEINLNEKGMRNATSVLVKFNIVARRKLKIIPLFDTYEQAIAQLKLGVRNTRDIEIVREELLKNNKIDGKDLGHVLNQKLNYNWKPASEVRCGYDLKNWCLWIDNIV